MANTEKDEAATMTTVMAVAMAGKAIRPSLDVLQQLVKAQRENVSEIISDEQAQIRKIKEQLNDEVRHVTLEQRAREPHTAASPTSLRSRL